MTECVVKLAAAEEGARQAQGCRDQAVERVGRARDDLAGTIRQPGGFSAETYLQHEASCALMIHQVNTAEVACRAALGQVQVERVALAQARRAVARAQTSLDMCIELRAKQALVLQQAAEAEADDEAAEAAVGRKFRSRQKAAKAAAELARARGSSA